VSPSRALAVAYAAAALVKSLVIYLFVTAPQRLAACPSAVVAVAELLLEEDRRRRLAELMLVRTSNMFVSFYACTSIHFCL
jgi:hypothetical protein